MESIILRNGKKADLDRIIEIFESSISSLGIKDYSMEQVNEWKKRSQDRLSWEKMINEDFFQVSEVGGVIAGFGSLRNGNHIELMYVAPEFVRRGIASKIISELVAKSKSLGHHAISSDVSETAKSCFEKMGFISYKKQIFLKGGIEIYNYEMKQDA